MDWMQATALLTGAPGANCFPGVYPALVIDVVDDDQQGRVRVRVPGLPDPAGGAYEAWARLATMMAGANRGTWFIPDVDDEVLVAFEAGDPDRPYVIGAPWNGQDAPPESMDGAGNNHLKTIRSRQGILITLDDTDGAVKLRLETPGGHKVVLDDGQRSRRDPGQQRQLGQAGERRHHRDRRGQGHGQRGTVEVSAGMVTVNAGMSKSAAWSSATR